MIDFQEFISRNGHNFKTAFQAVLSNRTRSMLTALGIIFGVAAVISMMAVGKGAEQEVLEQIKLVGVNNIVITPQNPVSKVDAGNSQKGNAKYSPGLSISDAEAIAEGLSTVSAVSPQTSDEVAAIANGKRANTTIHGVDQSYFSVYNVKLRAGKGFSQQQIENHTPVCIIGSGLEKRLFPYGNSIGQRVKCGVIWYTVIDVIVSDDEVSDELESMGVNSMREEVFVPIQTLLLRYKNKGLITERLINSGYSEDEDENPNNAEKEDHHQLSQLVVQVNNTEELKSTVEVIHRKMLRLHNGVEDFKITVPELLLKQQQKTKNIFNLVLGAIAGISLIVGGIGIMNIMLASVMERIKEIGLRLAVGARKLDIQIQFMFEALIISVSGGLFGVMLGVGLAYVISTFFEIQTIVSIWSVLVSFGVSAAVGVVFGYFPAKKAAAKDPVNSLRYE